MPNIPLFRRSVLRRTILLVGIALSGGALFLPRPLLLCIFFLCAAVIFQGRRITFRRSNFPIYTWIFAVVAILVIRPTAYEATATTIKLVNFFVALILLAAYNGAQQTLSEDFARLTHPMAYQAIGTVILKAIVPGLFLTLNIDGTTTKSFLLIFNYHDLLNENPLLVRPDGIFWEPGVFQIYLNIFVYIKLFSKPNIRQALLGSIAVISTQSTTGIIILSIILGTHIIKSKRLSFSRKNITILAALSILLPAFLYIAQANITEKLFGEARNSSLTREFDLYTGLLITQAHPLVVIGFSKDNYVVASSIYGFGNSDLGTDFFTERQGTSNGFVQAFYSIGIPLGAALIIGLFRQSLLGNRKLVFAITILSLIGEALMFTPFFLLLSFSGLARKIDAPKIAHSQHS